ncbi:MAG TPA: sugar ABC transporter ATP-binding protein, partial [Planctomycetaceae bacterium]|nr:sugar ABC transporter ATP-binding protein [Planctomycetaceae bacterium]
MQPSPLLTLQSISKRFGPTQALKDVSLRAQAGRVLALIGENGAGKSTLMKILSGAYHPDSGQMMLGGQPFAPTGPLAARNAGVAMIYQELNLAPDLSVEDNIMLGREASVWGFVSRGEQRPRVREALEWLGHPDLSPTAIVGELSVGAQQLVEIARALVHDARIIVFDEPTSSLTQRDTQRLFDVIRRLKATGRAVIYISHFLEEIRTICDDYAVLRDGRSVGEGELANVTEDQIVALMVGRSVEDLFPQVAHTPGEPLLSLAGLSGRRIPVDASFELRRGEILGLSGLVGAGRTELVRCLFGLDPVRTGVIKIRGNMPGSGPRGRIRAGLGMVSEDRKREGLAQTRSLADNLTLSRLEPYSTFGVLNLSKRRAAVKQWLSRMQVKCRDQDQSAAELSGGNQQKVAIARTLHQEADVLLLDEPTRGIDVGTKSEIYRLMGELAAQGKAVLFVSSYLTELMAVCDRIGVMSRGRLRALKPTSEWTEEAIMNVATRGDE